MHSMTEFSAPSFSAFIARDHHMLLALHHMQGNFEFLASTSLHGFSACGHHSRPPLALSWVFNRLHSLSSLTFMLCLESFAL